MIHLRSGETQDPDTKSHDRGRELSSGKRRLRYARPERLLVHSRFLKIFGKYSGENIHMALHGHKVTNFPWLSVIYEGSGAPWEGRTPRGALTLSAPSGLLAHTPG